ncbi:ATP-binding protein [Sulfuricurvum sp.]|uniref:sensor histidine kinase n=1 Tax=Sulfuricurvum sp. TaxID=2025608 RepID=UPI00261272D4|nr:ATP-binding protein [Sulfuricurvum sp.]MDD2267705.1 ATP-binding protein [Sulfuricurvum sp.]MDD2949167.1 ATP-binding protein [Sulfuricurvum sp.]
MNSIRSKLLATLMGTAFCAMSIAAIAVYFEVKDETNELFDYQLEQMAGVFLNTSTLSFDHFINKSNIEEIDNDFALIVYDAQHKKIYSTGMDVSIPYPSILGYKDQIIENKKWSSFSAKNNDKTVTVLQPEEARQEIAASTALMSILPFLIVLPIFALLIWFIVRKELSPINDFQNTVSSLDEHRLEPLIFSYLPRELKPLGDALNAMIERLKIALQARKNFVADAAHELRTPLSALLLQLELAKKSVDPKETQTALETLGKGILRANRLIEQLLMLARQEKSSDRMDEKTDLTHVVSETLITLLPLAEAKKIELIVEQIEPASIIANEYDIQTLVTNLLDNAIRYTPQRGTVSIGLYILHNVAVLKIIDNGIGVNESNKERVFDRFYRVNNHHSIGSGLGLSIVKEICQKYDIKIILEDNIPSGTIVTLEFHQERSV